MKTKVKRMSKRTLAVFLGVIMLVTSIGIGSLITVSAYDTVQIHTNADVSGNWKTTKLSTSDGNYYTGTIYFKGKTSGNYEMGIKINGDWKVFGGYWINDNTWYNTAWGSGSNDQIPPISTSTTTYIKGAIEFYKEYSGNPRLKIDQSTLSALSTTATVGATSLRSGQTTTVGKSNSGGSGTYTNTYIVKQGSASGTDVTSSVLSGTTFTAPTVASNTTYYVTTTVTDSNTGATATSSAKTITVSPAETLYTVNVAAGSNGSVASGSVSAGASTSATLPTATPNYGYKFKNWTASGGGVTITNATSANAATITATGTGGTVTANFEKNDGLNLYLTGRFRVRDSSNTWHYVGGSSGTWNTTYTSDTNFKFAYDSTSGLYKLNTRASLNELKLNAASGGDQYFKVYDPNNSKTWGLSSNNAQIHASDNKTQLTNSTSKSLYFNDSSDDSPVTIWFDATSQKIWYSIPNFYDVTVSNPASGGTVTASPTRCEEGTTVTLTISPTNGWELSGITTSPNVTLSGSGSTRTFSMPASNVTVTPTFTKKKFSGLTAVGKYSTDGTNFNTNLDTNPATITSTTNVTQVDGTAVSVPGTDPTGYVFAGWYTASGSFANAANKDTTFYPNAANAVAIAKYKKIFDITYSIDNTGTGAGTVTTSKSTVEAGGSYTITATVKNSTYHAIESIKVNGTSQGTNASTNVSSVSADQNVVVKFKSKVYVRGGSTIGTNWTTGDIMTANAAGTEFTKTYSDVAGASGGTQYQFKLHNGSYVNPDGTATVNITGGSNTATYSYQTSGDNNNVLTLKKNCNITIVSNGAKITSITVRPTTIVQKTITFKHVDGATITGSYDGTNFTTASADAAVSVYENDDINFTVTAASGKYLSGLTTSAGSLSPSFSVADSYTGKIANVTAAATVTPTAANKLAVTAKTNKSARGTVSINKNQAIPGETVTITCTPKSGILTELVVTNASTNAVVKRWTRNSSGDMKVAAAAKKSYKKSKDVLLTGADDPLTFEMPSAAVTVTATYGVYSAESNWYYNGYDTSANKVAAYHSKQMTEGMVGGEKFSYYHVEGRTGSDHLFTVSDGMVVDTRYVYFTRPKNYSYWSTSNSPKAHFWKNGGSEYDTWPGNTMTWVYDNDMGEAVFKIAIPVGADRVSFNDASNNNQQQTVDIDLTNTSGAYYVSGWNEGAQKYNYGTWNTGNSDQGYVESGTEYFYNSSIYTADFSTKGFYNHNTNSKDFSKPKDLHPYTGDYYVNVLYPGKTYTINGVTKTVGNNNPLVIWTADPLMGDDEAVTVYAKDGSIRGSSKTYADIADTKIYASDGTTAKGTSVAATTDQTYETYKASKGETIVIKTTVVNAQKSKYYVRGFCVNGEVSELLSPNTSTGVYTLTYKIPEDIDSSKLEITPIYYLVDSDNKIVTFRVTGFTDTLKEVGNGKPNWGDTLYAYPFYGKLGGHNNAFGAYPGQPLVYYKGQYQIQIPKKSTAWAYDSNTYNNQGAANISAVNNTNVSGVTMSNGYYDVVHKSVMGYGDNSASADHVQTYDYGDFFKIFNEKAPVDNIVFDFKYKTKKHNLTDIITTNTTASALNTKYGTGGNGFELLTNFHGRHVDLFGTPLSGSAADPEQTTPVYVVSTGGVIDNTSGVENIAGYYATEWVVYGNTSGTTYQRISGGGKTSIPPEVLILNDDDNTSFNDTTYPSAVSGKNLTDWKALYTALEAYRGKPVMISYEAADAQQGQGKYYTGTGGATRNDGRWLYSKNGETITSKIRVDVSEDNGVTYTDNSTLNTPVSDLDAYFTNAEVEGETTYTTTIDPDKTFDMEAHSNNADYKFMGWYMDDGTKITTDNVTQTERSGSYTFVARFMHFTGGQLILGHKAVKGTAANSTNYNGSGNATIAVTVKNGDEIVREIAASSSDITLDDKIINNENSGYTIEVTLNASGTGEDTYARTECSAANTFFGGQSSYTTMPQTFTFTVGSLFSNNTQATKKITYSSYFNEVKYSYKYTFNFPDRAGNTKSYVREGALTAAQRETYVTGSGNESRVLSQEFMNRIAPHESNFNQTLKWNITASDRTFTKSGNNYTLTKSLTAVVDDSEGARSTKRTATFSLPYAHTDGVPSNINIMDKATSTNFIISEIEYGTLVKTGSGEDDYVVAPRQLNDEGTVKNFQYWSMASTKNPGVEVARCYFYSFNFVAYDSYIITPIYDTAVSPLNSGTGSDAITTISFLETSRNQFNGTGASSNDLSTAADILYNDFVLSYNYNGLDIYKNDSSSSAVTNIGYVVERVQKLEVQQDGTPYTDPSHYSGKNLKTVGEVKDFITSGTNTTGLTKYEVQKNSLDNKNRIEFYEAYYNSRNWDKDSQKFTSKSAYKNYVYKAYTYMIVDGEVYLSDPAYFTMYDEATK